MKENTVSNICNILKECEVRDFKEKAIELLEKVPKEKRIEIFFDIKKQLYQEALIYLDKELSLYEVRKKLEIL